MGIILFFFLLLPEIANCPVLAVSAFPNGEAPVLGHKKTEHPTVLTPAPGKQKMAWERGTFD